jgi:2-oxoglutarate/2-oxoacid ferredoxin oxidoreductase subunit alpha
MAERITLMSGNEACAEGAIMAGARYFAGYPITPSSEIAEHLSRRLPQVGGVFMQMEDEIASMAAIIGASIAGVKSLTATSGPGFSLKQENLGFACFTEVPCIVVNCMRGGPSTGLPTLPSQADVMQAKWGTHGDHPIIALVPCSVQESFDLMIRAFNLSEKYRVPVLFLLDELIAHMREPLRVPDPKSVEIINRIKPTCPPEKYYPYDCPESDINPMANFGEGYRYHITGLNHDKTGFPSDDPEIVQRDEERLLRKIERNKDDIITYEEKWMEDADIAVFAYGSTARSAKDAIIEVRKSGIKAGLFRPITLWPFPEKEIAALAEKMDTIIVAEMNLGQMVYEVERCSKGKTEIKGVFQASGEPITPAKIIDAIKGLK